jgi:hypothetical protein
MVLGQRSTVFRSVMLLGVNLPAAKKEILYGDIIDLFSLCHLANHRDLPQHFVSILLNQRR